MSKKVCLFGASGKLGQELQRFIPVDTEVHTIDRSHVDFSQEGQISALLDFLKPGVIINASAYNAVDRAESERELAYIVNASAPAAMAKWAADNAARMIHVSTDYVFDGKRGSSYFPRDPVSPINIYGGSKAEGETQVGLYLKGKGVILRTSWCYSQFGNNFVKTMLNLMGQGKELNIAGDRVGSPTWFKDFAEVLWGVVENPDVAGTYHWTNAGIASWYDFAVSIQEEALECGLLTKEVPIHMTSSESYAAPAQRPSCVILDKTESYKLLGDSPHWRESLKKMLIELKNTQANENP